MGLKEATATRLVCRLEIVGGFDSFLALVGQRERERKREAKASSTGGVDLWRRRGRSGEAEA